MLISSEDEVLAVFEKLHGKMTGSCYAEVVEDDDGKVVGVACMKGGHECWRTTLAEMAFDSLAQAKE